MTLANRLTLLRLALVPAFMVFMVVDHFWTRLAALIMAKEPMVNAALSGKLDGVKFVEDPIFRVMVPPRVRVGVGGRAGINPAGVA